MKHIYTLIITSLLLISGLHAQDFKFAFAAPDTFLLPSGDVNGLTVYFELTNTGSDSVELFANRISNDLVSGQDSYFCWDLCYGPAKDSADGAIMIAPGDTTNFAQYVQLLSNGVDGKSSVTMDFVNANDTSQRIARTYHFFVGGAVTSNERIDLSQAGLTKIFPNPANTHMNISYELPTNIHQGHIRIVNLIGASVANHAVTSSNDNLTISTASLPSGLYFANLIVGDQSVASKKFVVSH
ncbi:MAG: T9SS type A sorting domain-containing protein [Bacteroidota bacterium]